MEKSIPSIVKSLLLLEGTCFGIAQPKYFTIPPNKTIMKNEEKRITRTTINTLQRIGKISLQKFDQGKLLQAIPVILV